MSSPSSPPLRALSLHIGGGAKRWDKTRHIFPASLPQMRPVAALPRSGLVGWAGLRAAMLGALPGGELFRFDASQPPRHRRRSSPTEFPPLEPLRRRPPSRAVMQPCDARRRAAAARQPITIRPPQRPPVIYRDRALAAQPAGAACVRARRARHSTPPIPALDEWPLSRLAAAVASPLGAAPTGAAGQSLRPRRSPARRSTGSS